MRNSYIGQARYTLIALGILSGGVWLVALATVDGLNAARAKIPSSRLRPRPPTTRRSSRSSNVAGERTHQRTLARHVA